MNNHFPLKSIMISVALHSILNGLQSTIVLEFSDDDSKIKTSFLLDAFSLIIVLVASLYTEKFKLSGRKGYFLKNSFGLAGCFIYSSIFIYADNTLTKLLGFAVLIIQNVCKVNVLTTILSIVSLQNLEVGFYFGLQFLVFELGSVFGSLIYFAFETNSSLFVFYIFSVICYAMISYSISRDLSEDHDEIDNYDWKLWIDIVRVRFFRMNFTSFSITLGVASYIYIIAFQTFGFLNLGIDILIILSMLLTYPISLYLVYKYLRPIKNKAFIVFGLIFQSLALMLLMIVYVDEGKNSSIIALASPILSQVGLVFVTVSALPDMIKSTKEELVDIEKGILTDRVCSVVYAGYYIGKIVIIVFTYILRELMSFEIGVVTAGMGILLYAAVYEYYGHGVRNFKENKVEDFVGEISLKGEIDMSEYLIVK